MIEDEAKHHLCLAPACLVNCDIAHDSITTPAQHYGLIQPVIDQALVQQPRCLVVKFRGIHADRVYRGLRIQSKRALPPV